MSDHGNPIAKAIHDSQTEVAIARAETRKRKFWAYVTIDELNKWAEKQDWENNVIPVQDELVRKMFGTALDAPVVRGTQGKNDTFAGVEMIAVWRRLEPMLEGQEPNFDEP